jgi:hypothetical protein
MGVLYGQWVSFYLFDGWVDNLLDLWDNVLSDRPADPLMG